MATKISAQEASKIAKSYYDSIAEDKHRLSLEETELSDDGKYWLITLGIYTPTSALMLVSQGINEALNYKIFKIDATSGDVKSMKIRQFPLQAPLQPPTQNK